MSLFRSAGLPALCLAFALLVRTDTGGAAPAAPFVAPVTFEGRTGCGALQHAADVVLTLRADGTYATRIVLGGREQSAATGSWHLTGAADQLVLNAGSQRRTSFRIVDGSSLERIYAADAAPAPSCFERLTRSAHVVALSGRMASVTLTSDVWTLESLAGERLGPAAGAKLPTLTFARATERFSGSTGCGPLLGTYAQATAASMAAGSLRAKITLSPKATNREACPPRVAATRARLVRALARTSAIHICCSTLELLDTRGTVLAAFRTTR